MHKTIIALTLTLALLVICQAALAESLDPQAPDVKVYHSIAKLDLDFQPYLDAVGGFPTMWVEDDGDLYVGNPDRPYTSVKVDFPAGRITASYDETDTRFRHTDAWHIGGVGHDWQPADTHCVVVSVVDEQGTEIQATWNIVSQTLQGLRITMTEDILAGYNGLYAVPREDASLRIVSLNGPVSEEGYSTLYANYGEDGLLMNYYYLALDGTGVRYQVEDVGVYTADDYSPAAIFPELYPPLELVME